MTLPCLTWYGRTLCAQSSTEMHQVHDIAHTAVIIGKTFGAMFVLMLGPDNDFKA